MKKAILLAIIFTFVAFSAAGQTKQELIKELFSLMKTESMFDNLAASSQMLQTDSISKQAGKRMMESFRPLLNKLLNEDLVELYDKYYTKNEIKEMIRFYKSDTGQKMINTTPELQKQLMMRLYTELMSELKKGSATKSETNFN